MKLLPKKTQKLILISSFAILLLLISTNSTIADDDEDEDGFGFIEDDTAKDIGYVAIGLFAVGMVNVIVLYIFKWSRKFLDDEGRSGETKESIKNLYLRTRKPLNWFHYLATTAATTIVVLHGIRFITEEEAGVTGWIVAGLFLLYIITGIIIKLKVKPFWNNKIAKKILNLLHRNLIIFLGVIVLHIIHLLIAD